MLEHLTAELRDGLADALRRKARRQSRLSLHIGDAVFPVIRMWDGGFSLDSARLSRLRGFVQIHDGPRHILSGLIVAAEIHAGELVCTFKRVTPASTEPALDYWRGESQVSGLLRDS